MKNIPTQDEAYRRLTTLCARSEHCTGQMRQKMRQWQMPSADIEAVVDRLVDNKFVDDERYVGAFVSDKVRYDRWGPKKIEAALRMNRLDDRLIRQALDEVDTDLFAENLSELIAIKRRSLLKCSEQEAREKLIRFALSRGYTYDMVSRCLNL